MQQISKTYIDVGDRPVGSAWVDGGAVRGEGGPLRPQLVVPLTISLESRPEESTIAVVSVRARLLAQRSRTPGTLVTKPIVVSLASGFPARSLPEGSNEHIAELRFFLTQIELASLETHRHSFGSDPFQLHLAIEPVVVALKTFNQFESAADAYADVIGDEPRDVFRDVCLGIPEGRHSVSINIEQSMWVWEVLARLGYDRVRLMELDSPGPLPEPRSAGSARGEARRGLDE